MAIMILFQFCGFIEHSKPNNKDTLGFPGKPLKLEKLFLIFYLSRNVQPKPSDRSC